ncbi:protein ASPARTIC PROTEASE IN GUARD CELL 2-like [Phoenix dactylifera]|uniref:Protein ASPARTIC PROTEASE IN GUARD CELL 2-like n=1 Tax=Phoenix dactylifera TaxID=42345 RepID=A0A8B7C3Z4_PHODC|nr:protein ASPARTIC PROTEASE IN GUARD CELL 2-like [Phoenix dactylifera]
MEELLLMVVFQVLLFLPANCMALATPTIGFQYLNVHELVTETSNSHHLSKSHVHKAGKWALNLVHRDAISGRNYSSHHHRFQELMNRDSRRVAGLTRRVAALTGLAYSSLQDFGSEVVSGLEEGSGEYFVRVGVGSPPREQYMVIDSGSDITWVQCQPCSQCYHQAGPVFDPAQSTTFYNVGCDSTVCGLLDRAARCQAGWCRYEVSYRDGSYTKGTMALEMLTFGQTEVRNVAIGCGHRNRGLFVGAAGLLGLGRGPMSFMAQLGGQTGGAFLYCLASRGMEMPGSIVFGRGAAVPTSAMWVPLMRNPWAPSLYYIRLVGLGVGGIRLPVPEEVFRLSAMGDGGVIMDTGTAVTRLPVLAYEAVRNAFVQGTMGLPWAPATSIFDTCYDLSGFRTVQVPTVSFYFAGGTVLTLPARNYMIPVDGMGTFCLAFAPSSSGLSIVGNIQQEGIQITFDLANGFVGFGPNTC